MTTVRRLRKPDDMHAHVRDGDMLRMVIKDTAQDFARAIIMPNLVPPIVSVSQAVSYRERIMESLGGLSFEPLMTLYLTEETTPEMILEAKASGVIHGIKNYPKGATTNSSQGVRDLRNVTPSLEAMQRCGMPLLLHGEVTLDEHGDSVDPFDRERIFVETTLEWLRHEFPELRIVLEHITSKEAAQYLMENGGKTLAATVTPHHLTVDRRALFEGGLNPHFYCLPVLKCTEDLDALRALVATQNDFVFAGTDTAPHPTHKKEAACACAAGCYVAPVALSMYFEVFEELDALHLVDAFLSENGANWYGLPLNEEEITLVRSDEPKGPADLVWPKGSTASERRALGEHAFIRDAVRPFGMHTDPEKSMKWHWSIQR